MSRARGLRLIQGEMFPELKAVEPETLRWKTYLSEALALCENDRSEHTKLTYQKSLAQWARFCETHGAEQEGLMPVRDREVFLCFLQWLKGQGYARETIGTRKRCLSSLDALARGNPGDTLNTDPNIRRWWKAYMREVPSDPSGQAPVISRAELAAIIGWLYARPLTPMRAVCRVRERAMLLLGYAGAFRRSEICEVRVGWVQPDPRGVFVRWPRSKADQFGVGEERLLLPQAETLLCPVDAFHEWLRVYGETERWENGKVAPARPPGPEEYLFPVTRGHLIRGSKRTGECELYRRVRNLGKHVGVRLTPHSLRAMFATHASELHEEAEIAAHGRWKSRTVMQRYVRRGRAHKKNPTAGLTTEGVTK